MKKIIIPIIVILLTVFSSVVMAGHDMIPPNGDAKTGTLLLFQKCDESLINTTDHDSFGCPNIGTGPWPIFPGNHRWGQLRYSLWGPKFKFSFQGRNLLPGENYTLIYYPDPWPGNGLICLGSGTANSSWKYCHGHGRWGQKGGNIEIHGDVDIGTGLPAQYDANFNPTSPSGAVGAKIWLVLSDDVQCTSPTQMLNWNPTAYLFEYNLINFENQEVDVGRFFKKK